MTFESLYVHACMCVRVSIKGMGGKQEFRCPFLLTADNPEGELHWEEPMRSSTARWSHGGAPIGELAAVQRLYMVRLRRTAPELSSTIAGCKEFTQLGKYDATSMAPRHFSRAWSGRSPVLIDSINFTIKGKGWRREKKHVAGTKIVLSDFA